MECKAEDDSFLTTNLMFDRRNEKATFYTDAKPSEHLRGRQSIVPWVFFDNLITFILFTRMFVAVQIFLVIVHGLGVTDFIWQKGFSVS